MPCHVNATEIKSTEEAHAKCMRHFDDFEFFQKIQNHHLLSNFYRSPIAGKSTAVILNPCLPVMDCGSESLSLNHEATA